jgi:hypothetical protein
MEAITRNGGVIIWVEPIAMLGDLGGYPAKAHLVEERRVPLEPPGDHPDYVRNAFGLVVQRVPVPEASGRRASYRKNGKRADDPETP